MFGPEPLIKQRLHSLEQHLQHENPVLIKVVGGFRELDSVAYGFGLLDREQSFATLIPWWPLVSILGTFSAGKSSFINHYLQHKLQASGNQAVDDKFTVVCHSRDTTVHTLPGLALDADPRFPFYQISEEIEKVAGGEGARVDSYLQLKTCPSEKLRGKIIIDSPGFDADQQRTATLRITEHIVDLSDLVLVFFDARHPEPGAMQDTLKHLVSNSVNRSDSTKFLYILNQIDSAAREDNPEEVFGAWQRALSQSGLTAGRFYTIYNPDISIPIEDEEIRRRFEAKRDADLAEIHARIKQVEIERAYRIVGALEKTARDFEERIVPLLTDAIERWSKRTLIYSGLMFTLILTVAVGCSISAGMWQGWQLNLPEYLDVNLYPIPLAIVGLLSIIGVGYLHIMMRRLARRPVLRWLTAHAETPDEVERLHRAFKRSTRIFRTLFTKKPVGWGRKARLRVNSVIAQTDHFVQMLNDTFANPSGQAEDVSAFNTAPISPSKEDLTDGTVSSLTER